MPLSSKNKRIEEILSKLCQENIELLDELYSLIKKGSEPTEILRTNILSDKYIEIYNDNYYICEILEDEEGNEYQKVSFYTTKGTLITSVDTLAYSSIERESASAYEMTSYILETEDGFVVVILK